MERRDFVVGIAGVLATIVAPAVARSGIEPGDRWQGCGVVSGQSDSAWLSYPSDPDEIWLSLGVLTNVRHGLLHRKTDGAGIYPAGGVSDDDHGTR